MKTLFLALLLLPAYCLGTETETLIKADTSFPAQGGPGVRFASINGTTAMLLGGRGVLLLGETTGIGVSSYTLSSEITTSLNNIKRDLSFSYFGMTIDNFFIPKKLFFLNLSTMVGYGFASDSQRVPAGTKDQTSFFLIEPEINLMLNVTKELRVAFGLSYRLLAGSEAEATLGANLSGFAGSFTLLYGK